MLTTTWIQDFGFPSTHTMNSISNSGFVLLYVYDPMGLFPHTSGAENEAVTKFPLGLALLMVSVVSDSRPYNFTQASVWISLISIGRLYLGVHSPPDLRGGAVLGVIMALW